MDITLLDGGNGQEIYLRSNKPAHPLWSVKVMLDNPNIVIELFSSDEMVILAWLHFLVMDTFIGRYIWMRMLAANRPIQVSMPILLTCMMIGPIGLMFGILATLDVEDDISIPTRPLK